MPDVTASYGNPFDFITFSGILIHYYWPFMSELLFLHQTFTNYISYQYWYVKLLRFFCEFCTKLTNIHVWSIVSLPNFHRYNTHILICWHARYNYKLRRAFGFDWDLWKYKCLIRYSSPNFHKFCGKLLKII